MVRKILRALPKKFSMKVTVIEEAQDISSMQVDELIGSLQTYEMILSDSSEKKIKSVAFVSNTDGDDDNSEKDMGEEFSDALALLGRQFNKVFKRFDRKSSPFVHDKPSRNFNKFDNYNNPGSQKKLKEEDSSAKERGVQCHECEGYGHFRAGCPTYLKKQNKGMMVTCSD